jgi:hypothetical protein
LRSVRATFLHRVGAIPQIGPDTVVQLAHLAPVPRLDFAEVSDYPRHAIDFEAAAEWTLGLQPAAGATAHFANREFGLKAIWAHWVLR